MSTNQTPKKNQRWNLDERVALRLLYTKWTLDQDQVHDIFYRLFGARWIQNNRSYYNARRLREEWTTRWNDRKSQQWDRVDSPTPDSEVANLMIVVRQHIENAARQRGTPNHFTHTLDSPITLPPAQSSYVAVGRPSRRRTASHSAESSRPTPVAGSTSRRRSDNQTAHQSAISGPSTFRSSAIFNGLAPSARPAKPLEMVHTRFIQENENGQHVYNEDLHPGFVDQQSPLYRWGGPARQLRFGNRLIHVIQCVAKYCEYCRRSAYEDEDMGISNVGLDDPSREGAMPSAMIKYVDRSPFQGLPFVHAGRDLRDWGNGLAEFDPEGEKGVEGPSIPNAKGLVLFDDTGTGPEGSRDVRAALLCVPEECIICKIHRYETLLGPDDVAEWADELKGIGDDSTSNMDEKVDSS